MAALCGLLVHGMSLSRSRMLVLPLLVFLIVVPSVSSAAHDEAAPGAPPAVTASDVEVKTVTVVGGSIAEPARTIEGALFSVELASALHVEGKIMSASSEYVYGTCCAHRHTRSTDDGPAHLVDR